MDKKTQELEQRINELETQLGALNRNKNFISQIENSIINERKFIDPEDPPTSLKEVEVIGAGGGSVVYPRFPDGFVHFNYKGKIYKVPFFNEQSI